ncbi:hypothetical protein TGDOM2_249575 [Toxoplasma gondii GAB2-2007-GAL-DOM2]|uniref:Uncharacterized protein n=3 Tax=Toxoplasma gondii TaxID=5811 RepID=A0A086LC65_TOXGO|nr:hypothetical protein TGDOM2_249575 [Toxoplasma gondii GAB2-2007-GAL-DOM2]KFG48854.1 hypothetical protein TGP89_249575 [Toxoplasma gondii p89]KFG54233.1 hypothetical protein TGFOU_249575 [Toxoplasma gondii FOU]
MKNENPLCRWSCSAPVSHAAVCLEVDLYMGNGPRTAVVAAVARRWLDTENVPSLGDEYGFVPPETHCRLGVIRQDHEGGSLSPSTTVSAISDLHWSTSRSV